MVLEEPDEFFSPLRIDIETRFPIDRAAKDGEPAHPIQWRKPPDRDKNHQVQCSILPVLSSDRNPGDEAEFFHDKSEPKQTWDLKALHDSVNPGPTLARTSFFRPPRGRST